MRHAIDLFLDDPAASLDRSRSPNRLLRRPVCLPQGARTVTYLTLHCKKSTHMRNKSLLANDPNLASKRSKLDATRARYLQLSAPSYGLRRTQRLDHGRRARRL